MSRQIDLNKPLSDEDVAWLRQMSKDHLIDTNHAILAQQAAEAEAEDDDDDDGEPEELPVQSPNPPPSQKKIAAQRKGHRK